MTLTQKATAEPALPVTREIQDGWAALLEEGLRVPRRFDNAVAAIQECKGTGELRPEQIACLKRVWVEVTGAVGGAGGAGGAR